MIPVRALPTAMNPERHPNEGQHQRRRPGVSPRILVAAFALVPLNVFFITGFSWLVDDFTGWSPIFANTLTIVFLLASSSDGAPGGHSVWARC